MEWAGELVGERTMGSMRLVKILIADTRAASHLKCTPGVSVPTLDRWMCSLPMFSRRLEWA